MTRAYDILEEAVCVAFFVLIFLLMNLGVFGRYFFNISFEWNIELCCYSFVWLTFLGAAYVRRRAGHIKVDIFYLTVVRRLSPAGQRSLFLLRELIMVGFLLALVVLGLQLAIRSWRFMSQAMQISQSFLYIAVPVGAAMFLYREIGRIVALRFGALPEPADASSGDIG